VLQQLLAMHSTPLLATTLIAPGDTEPLNDAQEIRERYKGRVAAVIDSGACPREPTTVVDLTGGEPVVIRQGRGSLTTLGL
jgi:tRNA A37 threonylcarbamoyladenosine synthetase subunit TsaC/SUA5/YrdC